jgi:hypothetical protein
LEAEQAKEHELEEMKKLMPNDDQGSIFWLSFSAQNFSEKLFPSNFGQISIHKLEIKIFVWLFIMNKKSLILRHFKIK